MVAYRSLLVIIVMVFFHGGADGQERGALLVEEIEELLRAGVTPRRMATLIEKYGVSFEVAEEVRERLKRAGADAEVMGVVEKAGLEFARKRLEEERQRIEEERRRLEEARREEERRKSEAEARRKAEEERRKVGEEKHRFAQGGAIVIFEVHRQSGEYAGNVDIGAQRISADGKLLWRGGRMNVTLGTPKQTERAVAVIPDGSGGAIVVCEVEALTGEHTGDQDIVAQRIDADGELRWNNGERYSIVAASNWGEKNPIVIIPFTPQSETGFAPQLGTDTGQKADISETPSSLEEERSSEKPAEKPPPGTYKVVRSTRLFREPQEDADPVTWLREGTVVNVVGIVEGKWLRVESSHSDKPPGYLRQEDVMLVQK